MNCTASEHSPQVDARSRHLAISCGSCSTPTARATPAYWAAAAQKRPSPHPMSISRSLGPAPEVTSRGHSRMYLFLGCLRLQRPGTYSRTPIGLAFNVPANVRSLELKHRCTRAEACHRHGSYSTAPDTCESSSRPATVEQQL